MHTAFELKKEMFAVCLNGQPIDRDVLLNWEVRDRLGVIVDRPVGALGAGLFSLLAITAFYDTPGKRRRSRPLYPDIFLFHAGGPWGAFSNFDFWPDHKEIFVPPEAGELLRAINNRGITHLVVPDKPRRAARLPFKEPEAAIDRLKQCYVYDPSGATCNADVEIVARHEVILRNFLAVLNPDTAFEDASDSAANPIPRGLQASDPAEDQRYDELMRRRAAAEIDKSHPDHLRAALRIEGALKSGRLVESLRRANVPEVLEMLI